MGFYDKVKWVLGLLIIFVLIITTNLIDRNSFVRVRDSVVTIYEDRLIAHNLLFEMSRSINEKELAVAGSDSLFFDNRNHAVNNEIGSLISKFEQTRLTEEEGKVFDKLKTDFDKLKEIEGRQVISSGSTRSSWQDRFEMVKDNLYDLSQIQLIEGNRQMSISKKAIDTVELFTKLEIYILIVLAILVQIIVIYKPKEKQ